MPKIMKIKYFAVINGMLGLIFLFLALEGFFKITDFRVRLIYVFIALLFIIVAVGFKMAKGWLVTIASIPLILILTIFLIVIILGSITGTAENQIIRFLSIILCFVLLTFEIYGIYAVYNQNNQ